MLKYRITIDRPQSRMLSVELELQNQDLDGLTLALPAWIPGSYMIRDFARNITEIEAVGVNGRVSLSQVDKQTWSVAAGEASLRVCYRVYCGDLSVRGAHLDDDHAFFNGTSVFLRVQGREQQPAT